MLRDRLRGLIPLHGILLRHVLSDDKAMRQGRLTWQRTAHPSTAAPLSLSPCVEADLHPTVTDSQLQISASYLLSYFYLVFPIS